ncbi:ribonuclease HI [Candidatus Peregrinibacteria bacterium]|nr:ribonuclease HI [Candidatus Peregrinibacteria bacterium]
MKKTTIYTDGACVGNPGPGGYGVLILGPKPQQLSGGFAHTTNNRMELMACIKALEELKTTGESIELFTDSTYVKEGITVWIRGWKTKGWKTSQKKPVKNADLWMRLDALNRQFNVEWKWVRGHNGNPHNETVDTLATRAAAGRNLKADVEITIGHEEAHSQPSLF